MTEQPAMFTDVPVPTSWFDAPLAGFDVETNGPDPLTARIVSYAFVVDGMGGSHSGVLQPDGFEIPDEAAAVHGITTERAREIGMPRTVALAQLHISFMTAIRYRMPVVIYNAPYDLTILRREIPGIALDDLLVVDPLVLDKAFDKYRRGSRKLGDVCAHYGITLGDDAHDAGADTLASIKLARQLCVTHPQIGLYSANGLQGQQRNWYRQQAESFERYLREKKGEKDAVIDPSWPWKGLP